MLDHRAALSGTQPLAVHDPQALQASPQRAQQKLTQMALGLRQSHAVQVDLGLDAIVAAAQPPQHGFGHSGLAVLQRIAGLDVQIRGRSRQALAQHRGALGAGLARAGRGRTPHGRGAHRSGQRPHVPHGLTENFAFLVLAAQCAFLREQAFSILARLYPGG